MSEVLETKEITLNIQSFKHLRIQPIFDYMCLGFKSVAKVLQDLANCRNLLILMLTFFHAIHFTHCPLDHGDKTQREPFCLIIHS